MLRRWRKRLYFVWATLRHRRACRQWYHFLDSTSMQPLMKLYPALPIKPLKPYLAISLDVEERIRVIQNSLLLMVTRWESIERIIVGQNPVIAVIDLHPDLKVHLCLEYNRQKEGELSLLLRMADGRLIAMASFAFDHGTDGHCLMRIGRIQGVKDHELLRMIEKTMHGLRPKSLMLFASQEFARILGITHIFGISDGEQVYGKKVLIPIPGMTRLAFDYDTFWREAGGIQEQDGWFRLPPSLKRRDISDIKANKRSMYKKRYAMLDDISNQMRSALLQATERGAA